jgi:AcrR family transcriptional regulator
VKGSDTRQRLIEAAEALFADKGIDAVSLAEITAAAGLNNSGAVHYHFGGREELLAAVVDQHRHELDRRREALLDQLEDLGEPSVAAVVRVVVEPLLAKLDDARGRAFLSIQAQRMLRPHPQPGARRPAVLRFLRLFGTPHLARHSADLHSDFMQTLTFGALAQRARLEAAGAETPLSREEFADHLVAAVVRVLDMPGHRADPA